MASDRKIKVGIVGCGVVATAYYLPGLMHLPNVELIAVCDTYKERTDACIRLFGARETYEDYDEMIRKADIEVVFILTGPGTHETFTLKALEAGKHVLLQKPMALTFEGGRRIHEATKKSGLKVLVEPSQASPLEPHYREIRNFVKAGVLGDPYWFELNPKGPEEPHPSLGGNPYGVGAFYAKDSGGILFDYPYAPNQIVSVLGSCKSVTGMANIVKPERQIVPDHHYNEYISKATDPENSNYWRAVVNLPKSQAVRMEAPDNVFSLYEMENGFTGIFHTPRLFLPTLKGTSFGDFQVFGTEGNLVFGAGYAASIITEHKELLPHVDDDGWYHIPSKLLDVPYEWPIPPKGCWNYYHESSRHLFECILNDTEPVTGVDWGLHILEMMAGAIESSQSGKRYEMTTRVDW